MKNFVQEGDTIHIDAAPYAVAAGAGLLMTSIFGVAVGDIENGGEGEIVTEGIFTLAKATGAAWAQGDLLYWDDSAKKLTKTSASNYLVGSAAAAAESADATGDVWLPGMLAIVTA